MASGGAPPTTAAGAPPSSSLSSGLSPPPPPPKILLAKPSSGPAAAPRLAREDDPSSSSSGVVHLRSRNAPQPGSLNLFSDSWDFHTDRILPVSESDKPNESFNLLSDSWEFHNDRILRFLTDNNDFTVVGIIGPPGVGKSTILNELYGFDGSSPGMLPPFATQSDETRAMAKHCTTGIELRVSAERLILLDAQPMFSPSVLVDMMRPDGSSAISVLNGESLSADLAHELLGIQVDLLKHNISDPSSLTSGTTTGPDKENKVTVQVASEEHLAALVFIHTKLRDQDLSPSSIMLLKKALLQYFKSSSFNVCKSEDVTDGQIDSYSRDTKTNGSDSMGPHLFLLPLKVQDDLHKTQFGSYNSMLGKLRDQILSMTGRSFAKTVSERDWLRNSAKIWELVKKSPVIADYCKTLQSSGLFRK